MLYSDIKKFIFIAIDKTGSTSIEAVLRPYSLQHTHFKQLRKRLRILKPVSRKLNIHRRLVYPVHASARSLKPYFPKTTWDEYFKFCFVRNPLDRITSRFEFLRKERRLPSHIQFDSYLNSILSGKRPFFHQHQYIIDKQSQIMVDWWGKLETIEIDCRFLEEKLGIPRLTPRRLNTSKANRRPFLDYYSGSQKRLTEEFVRRDLDLFNY
ncbi:MAG: sulfotransferase family 2 domain-containing protein [Synechococcaceae cyanobacterium]|nr:sulfotransferase family 2 domain-containing protein [Synechococcaceae cyanobacterium]